MIKGWFIAVAQGNRISGYNIMESYINERLEKGEYDLGGLGSGVGNALRAILPESWGRRSTEIAFPDPFALSLDEA